MSYQGRPDCGKQPGTSERFTIVSCIVGFPFTNSAQCVSDLVTNCTGGWPMCGKGSNVNNDHSLPL